MKCFLCKQPSVGTLVFETGNNAEYKVEPNMCEIHFKEAEDTGYDFEEKYAEQILEQLYENWRGQAEYLKDEIDDELDSKIRTYKNTAPTGEGK